MRQEPFVEQIHKIRREHARKFNFDLRAIFDDLKRQEKQSKQKIVSLPIKHRNIREEKIIAN